MTAIAVAYEGAISSEVVKVGVRFRPLTEDEIMDYIRTGEPMDKRPGRMERITVRDVMEKVQAWRDRYDSPKR
jgi:hypothetical protein